MKILLKPQPSLEKNKAILVSFFSREKAGKSKKQTATHPYFKKLQKNDASYIARVMAHDFSTSQEKFREVHLPSDPDRLIVLAHLGKKNNWSEKKFMLFGRKAVVYLKERKINSASLFFEDLSLPALTEQNMMRRLAENAVMADFTFNIYKAAPKDGWPTLHELEIIAPKAKIKKLAHALDEGVIAGEEINACRALANTPGGDMTPQKLADAAVSIGARTGMKVTVLEEDEMKKLGMGGVLGVAKGSESKPRFIIMEYGMKNGGKPIVLAGKGVTFDTGGLNLKPSDSIYDMHMDMAGGAAVMHALAAIARMKLPVKIIGLIPAVENMPSGASYRPGDILKTITGKTVEVLNTDAEGRIILADALGYAHRLKPRLIVDVATLTGAAIVALGQRAIALFSSSGELSTSHSTDDRLEHFSRAIGNTSGDIVWPLPLWDEYNDDIKGTFGDVANTGKKGQAGAIAGAMFLKQFVGNYPWMHLDIAPTMTTIEGQFLEKGASGTGVRFLIELARNEKKIPN